MRLLFLTSLILLGAACHVAPASRPKTPAPAIQPTFDHSLRALELKVFAAANHQRRLHGLPVLAWSEALADQARIQSTNMMERGFFSHVDPVRGPLAARLNAAGIPWLRCSENIFREQGMDDPPDSAVEGWMKSPAHRQSLLDPLVTQSGVGIAISPDTEYFITQVFLRPPK